MQGADTEETDFAQMVADISTAQIQNDGTVLIMNKRRLHCLGDRKKVLGTRYELPDSHGHLRSRCGNRVLKCPLSYGSPGKNHREGIDLINLVGVGNGQVRKIRC